MSWLSQFDINTWVSAIGYVGLFTIIFLETGLFLGFFLPGDSLIFTAGFLAAKGIFNIWIIVPVLVITAALGYTVGYWFGGRLGHWLIKRPDTWYFKKKYVHQAHGFYERHGGKALILGRLVPIVRTFVPIVAGMGEMSYKKYQLYNCIGALLWGAGISLAGFYLGSLIPNAAQYVLPVILVVIFLSILPGIIHFCKNRFR